MTQPPRLLHAPLPSEVEQKPWFVVSLSNHRPLSESVGKWDGNVGYETPKHE